MWGAPRIHGELLMLGVDIAQSTVAKYIDRPGRYGFTTAHYGPDLNSSIATSRGLDGSRIRKCPDCGALFWVQRKDRVGCSKPCANRLRFSRYYGIHKKSGIRSHPGRDVAITAKLRARNVPKS